MEAFTCVVSDNAVFALSLSRSSGPLFQDTFWKAGKRFRRSGRKTWKTREGIWEREREGEDTRREEGSNGNKIHLATRFPILSTQLRTWRLGCRATPVDIGKWRICITHCSRVAFCRFQDNFPSLLPLPNQPQLAGEQLNGEGANALTWL